MFIDVAFFSGFHSHMFSLAFACTDGQLEAVVLKHYGLYAGEESFKIYRGTSASGVLVLTVTGTSTQSSTDQYYSLCLETGDYFLSFADTFGDGWGGSSSPAYILITVGGVNIFKGGLPYQSGTALKSGSASLTVNPVSTGLTTWKYTDTPQTSNAWTQASFSDASWSTATSGTFPAFTSTTRYYRFTGTITNRNTIPTLYSALNNTYGFVYYLQGTEVYRFHMPTGTVTSTTAATTSDGSYPVVASANKFLLPTSGSFVLAYEVHLTSGTSGVADQFACFSFFGTTGAEGENGINRFFDGTAAATPEATSTYYVSSKMFDDGYTYYYYTIASSTPVITFTFNNGRAEWINYYSVQSSSSTTYGYPTGWTIYGSNDGTNWDTLDIQSGIVFATTRNTQYFSLRANTKSYNQFKMAVSGCSVSGRCSIGKFYSYTGVYATEPSGLSYDITSFTGYAQIDSLTMRPSINGYNNFSITPTLPAGVTISSTTGVISGTPTVAASGTYTISATSYLTSQSTTTQISLNIIGCTGPSHTMVRFQKISK